MEHVDDHNYFKSMLSSGLENNPQGEGGRIVYSLKRDYTSERTACESEKRVIQDE